MVHPHKLRLRVGAFYRHSHRSNSKLQSRVEADARRFERYLSVTREHPGSADSRMTRHRNFARRSENPHSSNGARHIGRGHECRLTEIQLIRERLHLRIAKPSRIAEDRKLIAAKRPRCADINECEFCPMLHRENLSPPDV